MNEDLNNKSISSKQNKTNFLTGSPLVTGVKEANTFIYIITTGSFLALAVIIAHQLLVKDMGG